jgi:hypothetical protein
MDAEDNFSATKVNEQKRLLQSVQILLLLQNFNKQGTK